MNAVGQQAIPIEKSEADQPLDRSNTETGLRGLYIYRIFGNVNMTSGAVWSALRDGGQCVVTQREARMQPDDAANTWVGCMCFDELEILFKSRQRLFVAVSVGDLVTQ
jgi:hypothetical protein